MKTLFRLTARRLTAAVAAAALLCTFSSSALWAQQDPATKVIVPGPGEKWAATWATAPVSAFSGTNSILPAMPNASTEGANEQTLRMIVRPDLWGKSMRFRFSNTFGTQPVTFGRVTVGLQTHGANIQPGTVTLLSFNGGSASVTIPVGQELYSDPVTLNFVSGPDDPSVQGRRLAVSMYVQGTSGRITYHQLSASSNYLSGSGTGDRSQEENDASFPYTTGGPYGPWFFIDAVDVVAPASTSVICALGDSITDRAFATFNEDDSWSDLLSRRLHAVYGNKVSVVNEAISGNRVGAPNPPPSVNNQVATLRLDRDVLGLSGLTHVVWLEGINDLAAGTQATTVITGYQDVVDRLHARGIKVVGATLISSLGPQPYAFPNHNTPAVDAQRQILNDYIRTSGLFDSVADMDAATLDPATGYLKLEYAAHSFLNPAPDYLHPGRAGYQAMALTIDLNVLAPADAR